MTSNHSDNIPRPSSYKRVKTPTVIQMEAVECGAASLGIILGYYGKFLTLEELRSSCSVTRDGVNALSILKAAEKYGLACDGHKLELEDLYEVPLPIIAFWDFNHFIVIEGFSKKYVYINDPASGPMRISYEELERSFTGVALLFELTPEFKKSGSPQNIFNLMYERLKNYKIPIFFTILTGIFIILPKLALPALTQVFIDNILIQGIYSWTSWFLFAMALAIVLLFILYYLQEIVLSRLMMKLSIEFSSRFLWHILYLPLSYYDQRNSGEIAYRMGLNDSTAHVITKKVAVLFIDSLSTISFGILMFYYDPLIASFGILMTLGNLALLRYLYRSRVDAYGYYQKSSAKSYAYSISSLQNIETVKATSMENKLFSRWAGYYTKTINSFQEISKRDVIAGVVPAFLENLTTIIVIGLGAWRVIEGYLTVGMLIALKILMQNFTTPIVGLVSSLQTIQLLLIDFNRIDDVLKNPVDKNLLQVEKNESYPGMGSKLKGSVDVKEMTFGYNPLADPVIKNINFSVNRGRTIALVGPSGCGKSTIAKIIGGLMVPWEGEIYFDKIPRNKLPRDLITNSLSLVEQEPFIFSASIKENLTCFETNVDDAQLIQATKDACIHDEIVSRHGGYEIVLENEGANLSGGQRQQIEIARALIKRPTVLILDEATSSIDSSTELNIFKNIKRRGCACIMIAHRLSTIRHCDEIIVIEKGEILQRGSHEYLMNTPGLYRDLNEAEKFAEEHA